MTDPPPPDSEATAAGHLALGRLFRLLSRPARPGDDAAYEAARAVLLRVANPVELDPSWGPNWARDHQKGAAGD